MESIKISENKLYSIISETVREVMLNEYLDKYFASPLKRYLKMSDEERKYALLCDKCYYFPKFLKEYLSELDVDIDNTIFSKIQDCAEYNDWDGINEILINEFGYDAEDIINKFFYACKRDEYIYDNPKTYDVMDYTQDIKNEWLVHFSDNADDIYREGFQYATYELDDLGYSGAGITKGKHHEGYDFAFLADRVNNWCCGKYGNEAVLFKASGIEAYHDGDDENQVMFYNKDAKDIVYLQYGGENGGWFVESNNGRILYETDDIKDLIDWVINNFAQYRKHLINPKESRIRRDNFKKSEYNYNRQFKG